MRILRTHCESGGKERSCHSHADLFRHNQLGLNPRTGTVRELAGGDACTTRHRFGREGGYLMIESLIYIPVLLVLLGVGFAAFYKGLENSRGLHRNTEDIARALKAGEQWREDIRQASGAVRRLEGEDWTSLEIPGGNGTTIYLFMEGEIWRAEDFDGPWQLWLAEVVSSEMAEDRREHVRAWTWELELAGSKFRSSGSLRPVFSFVAAAKSQDEIAGTEE